ncbi:hypothetical protein D3C77_285350 [compost metagenome]
MLGVGNRRARFATQITTILPGQLPGTLHSTLPAFVRAGFATEQGQATMQIGASAAQNIALAQQRSDVTGHGCQAQVLATQQQMGDARVCG